MRSFPFALLILIASLELNAAAFDFESEFARSEAAATTTEGAAYDYQLGTYLQAQQDWLPGLHRCEEQNPGAQTLRGYFSFAADGTYRVVVDTDNGFAKCFIALHESRAVPQPPQLPYVNPITFTSPKKQ